MHNSCEFVGHLGKDPEVMAAKTSGKPFTVFSIGVNRPGDKEAKTLWVNVVAFGPSGEFAGKYLKKGSLVLVQGPIEIKEYEGKDGKNHSSVSLVARELVSLSKQEGSQATAAGSTTAAATTPVPVTDEDIPF